jgi:thioredoxin 1
MKKILIILFFFLLSFIILSSITTMGTKPAPKTKDTLTVKSAAKNNITQTDQIAKDAKTDSTKTKPVKVPKLVDLGANKCMACKMMGPVLDSMKNEFSGKLEVVFIDVWKNSDQADKYKILMIPTQIFYDTSGKELFRHEGFLSRDDILAKWKSLGYEIKKENK